MVAPANMNKTEMLNHIKLLEGENESLKHNNDFLLQQQNELRAMVEKAGSEKAVYQVKCIHQEEELNKLNSSLTNLRVINNERNKSK